jgi:hypothetical protein
LAIGVLSINNIITVCPNHHRQLHYGNSILQSQTDRHFMFEIDEKIFAIEKILIEETSYQ